MKFLLSKHTPAVSWVTTCVVVWIEISSASFRISNLSFVTTCVVVWIEIPGYPFHYAQFSSPPAWWCGLKFIMSEFCSRSRVVTTCVVVWIEICQAPVLPAVQDVTTCVVVWIEITDIFFHTSTQRSPPAWWCGLKLFVCLQDKHSHEVTTCVVVWIEIARSGYTWSANGVTTCVVVWIEIAIEDSVLLLNKSPPAWWCGLKSLL